MKVTKCDICGAYVDKAPDEMPVIQYSYCRSAYHSARDIQPCYECYSKFLDEFGLKEEEEKKNGQHM